MPFQLIRNLGHGLLKPDLLIGDGDAVQPGNEVKACVENAEYLDTALKPILLRYSDSNGVTDATAAGAGPAITGTLLTGNLFRRWLTRIQRTSTANGQLIFEAAAQNAGAGNGSLHLVIYQTDLTTVVDSQTLTFAGGSRSRQSASFPQLQNPDAWYVACVFTENIDLYWLRLYTQEDTSPP